MTDLPSARNAYDLAHDQLVVAKAVDRLAQRRGLAHASLSGAPEGPHLVAYDGALLGEVRLKGPGSAVGCWTAHPYPEGHRPDPNVELSDDGHGPYVTLRAAAAGLHNPTP